MNKDEQMLINCFNSGDVPQLVKLLKLKVLNYVNL